MTRAEIESRYARYLAENPPPPERRPARRGFRFSTPEARSEYYAELAEARADAKRDEIAESRQPIWLRPMGADQRIKNHKLTED